jgi:hypothetical protein
MSEERIKSKGVCAFGLFDSCTFTYYRIKDFVSGAIENLSHDITTQKAYKELGLESQEDLIPGMEVRLMPHQAIGVAWFVVSSCLVS